MVKPRDVAGNAEVWLSGKAAIDPGPSRSQYSRMALPQGRRGGLSFHRPTSFSSSSSAFPAISLGFTIWGEIFEHVTVFFWFCFVCLLVSKDPGCWVRSFCHDKRKQRRLAYILLKIIWSNAADLWVCTRFASLPRPPLPPPPSLPPPFAVHYLFVWLFLCVHAHDVYFKILFSVNEKDHTIGVFQPF